MGINGAHKLTHQITGVSMEELLKIVQARRERRGKKEQPTIDIDVSYVFRKLTYKHMKVRVLNILRLCDMFCQSGVKVVLVCDSNIRHHSKRATCNRQVEKYKKKIELYNARCELIHVITQLNNTDSKKEKKRGRKNI